MRKRFALVVATSWSIAIVGSGGSRLLAQSAAEPAAFAPIEFSLVQQAPESVYAPPAPIREDEGVNEGGVHLDLSITYFTDYMFRGIERFEPPGGEDQANLQIDGKLSFDLGKVPHPFVAVFANIAESDPISTFQEIRPYVGLDWTVRPLVLSAGYTSYIFPDRDELETQEIWGRLELDDSYFLRSDRPLLRPYIFAAYDIDLYDGWYIEAGVRHDFEFEETGLTITALGRVAYVHQYSQFDADPTDADEEPSGFQHYEVGLIGTYSVNHLLNVSQRYGEWSLKGYLFYTDNIDDDLRADTQLWGGVGVGFRY